VQAKECRVRPYTKKERGTYCPISATDPDATMRNHGPKKISDGYNVTALQNMAQHHDLQPEKFVYDQAAGYGEIIEGPRRTPLAG
jgi:hypothetical protein